ncbi:MULTISPECIES: lysophospholipid acyltransferase family protein [Rhodococcus]|uniref:Lysophospholipid acyltransferase family protein n=1 Tax=Rhodococcus oxybenzonivorans TaxID=1990687 RepID=A0AAE4V4E1_9NOCA|nr:MULTISPECIES: lysophospholipid acyltransferase family protein [Rhodococcus]MDV7242943.1 lysophospholipid acyltransferase family protein [Rhodococcus oxybenzonivorans]MDV7267633.1 lysophospholipid acyltransferase family protein [Rhodococcus oxybenzonivorans]MDV7275347.1 lysophospholipid acyltransferase family protein [Rhodococcus oxybenzonivorans]MDV7334798.1 lysophospholipid acyltransferase family protein [Rhodococcus oxybenzonivorans]MDV7344952.1 lysophospholipid acyltransferase family pro
MVWYSLFKYVLIGPYLRYKGRPRIEGLERIPARGQVILAGNHLSIVDSFYLCLLINRPITFVAKSDYFEGRGLRGRALAWFFRAVKQIPISRHDPDAAKKSLEASRRVLDNGGIWAIYPEGSRSPDGRLYKGKTGVMRIALTADAVVFPVVTSGTREMNPIGKRGLRRGRVEIRICEPLDLSKYVTATNSGAVLRAATDYLMCSLQENSGQEYVDCYNDAYKSRSNRTDNARTA